eukprot:403331889
MIDKDRLFDSPDSSIQVPSSLDTSIQIELKPTNSMNFNRINSNAHEIANIQSDNPQQNTLKAYYDYGNSQIIEQKSEQLKLKLSLQQHNIDLSEKDNRTLKQMVRKLKLQQDLNNKEKNRLSDSFAAIEKTVYSLENIRYLESGRKISVEGLNQSHKFIFSKDREKMQQTLERCSARLEIEESETKVALQQYLVHLKQIKIFQQELNQMKIVKKHFDLQQKQFALMMKTRQKEFFTLRTIYGLFHLKEIFMQKEKLVYDKEFELESQMQSIIRTFQLHMLKRKIIKYQYTSPIVEYPEEKFFDEAYLNSQKAEDNSNFFILLNRQVYDSYVNFKEFYQQLYYPMLTSVHQSQVFFDYIKEEYIKVQIRQQFLQNRLAQHGHEKANCKKQLMLLKIDLMQIQELSLVKKQDYQQKKYNQESISELQSKFQIAVMKRANLNNDFNDQMIKVAGYILFSQRVLKFLSSAVVGPYVSHVQELFPTVLISDNLKELLTKYTSFIVSQEQAQIHIDYQIANSPAFKLPKKRSLNIKKALASFKQFFQRLTSEETFNQEHLEDIRLAVLDMLDQVGSSQRHLDIKDSSKFLIQDTLNQEGSQQNILNNLSIDFSLSDTSIQIYHSNKGDNLTTVSEDQDLVEFNNQIRKQEKKQVILSKAEKKKKHIQLLYESVEVTDEIKIMKQRNQLVNFEREELKFMNNLKEKIKKDYERIKYELPLQNLASPSVINRQFNQFQGKLQSKVNQSEKKPSLNLITKREDQVQHSRQLLSKRFDNLNKTISTIQNSNKTKDLDGSSIQSDQSKIRELSTKLTRDKQTSNSERKQRLPSVNESVSPLVPNINSSTKNKFINENSLYNTLNDNLQQMLLDSTILRKGQNAEIQTIQTQVFQAKEELRLWKINKKVKTLCNFQMIIPIIAAALGVQFITNQIVPQITLKP